MRPPPTISGEQSSPQGAGAYFLRARRGADGSAMAVGATHSTSTTFRAVVGDGRRRQFLSRRRLHQIAGQLRGDRAPAVGHAMPARSSVGVGPRVRSMSAEVIQLLEEDLGRKIYSRALFEYGGEEVQAKNLREEACEAAETVMLLQREVRLATSDGKLTQNEIEHLAAKHREATEELRDVGHLIASAS